MGRRDDARLHADTAKVPRPSCPARLRETRLHHRLGGRSASSRRVTVSSGCCCSIPRDPSPNSEGAKPCSKFHTWPCGAVPSPGRHFGSKGSGGEATTDLSLCRTDKSCNASYTIACSLPKEVARIKETLGHVRRFGLSNRHHPPEPSFATTKIRQPDTVPCTSTSSIEFFITVIHSACWMSNRRKPLRNLAGAESVW